MPTHSTPSTLLLLLIVLALAIGPRSALIPPPAFRGAKHRSEKVRSLEKRMGRPLRLKEGGRERDRRAETIPQSFPSRRWRRMPLPNNDAAGYDDSYYVMRHSSLHGWFKSPCERASDVLQGCCKKGFTQKWMRQRCFSAWGFQTGPIAVL